jgi:hypothetical protein
MYCDDNCAGRADKLSDEEADLYDDIPVSTGAAGAIVQDRMSRRSATQVPSWAERHERGELAGSQSSPSDSRSTPTSQL